LTYSADLVKSSAKSGNKFAIILSILTAKSELNIGFSQTARNNFANSTRFNKTAHRKIFCSLRATVVESKNVFKFCQAKKNQKGGP
jgi:hypothetical protein